MHWPHGYGPAASAGVWMRTAEAEISAPPPHMAQEGLNLFFSVSMQLQPVIQFRGQKFKVPRIASEYSVKGKQNESHTRYMN